MEFDLHTALIYKRPQVQQNIKDFLKTKLTEFSAKPILIQFCKFFFFFF